MNDGIKNTNDRDFKYVIQDTSHYYLGGRMNFGEMILWEDVPFKIKGIINKHFLPQAGKEGTFGEFFQVVDEESFEFQVIKQLHIKVKAGYYVSKSKKNGSEDKKYVSRTYSIEDYRRLAKEKEGVITEEIAFSKLALLAFSV